MTINTADCILKLSDHYVESQAILKTMIADDKLSKNLLIYLGLMDIKGLQICVLFHLVCGADYEKFKCVVRAAALSFIDLETFYQWTIDVTGSYTITDHDWEHMFSEVKKHWSF